MKTIPCFLLGIVGVGLSGCIAQVPVRASADQFAAADKLRASVRGSSDAVVQQLTSLVGARGLQLVNTVDAPDSSKVYVYKGNRVAVTTIRSTDTTVHAETNEIGSWFAVRVKNASAATDVSILAKPTVRGQEVCSDEDKQLVDVKYFCQDTKVRVDYPRRDLLTGKAEAEAAVGVIEQLKQAFP
jgi:hypothetical protein